MLNLIKRNKILFIENTHIIEVLHLPIFLFIFLIKLL